MNNNLSLGENRSGGWLRSITAALVFGFSAMILVSGCGTSERIDAPLRLTFDPAAIGRGTVIAGQGPPVLWVRVEALPLDESAPFGDPSKEVIASAEALGPAVYDPIDNCGADLLRGLGGYCMINMALPVPQNGAVEIRAYVLIQDVAFGEGFYGIAASNNLYYGAMRFEPGDSTTLDIEVRDWDDPYMYQMPPPAPEQAPTDLFATGDGSTTIFSGNLTTVVSTSGGEVIPGTVSVLLDGNKIATDDETGNLINSSNSIVGTIAYYPGSISSLTISPAPASGVPIEVFYRYTTMGPGYGSVSGTAQLVNHACFSTSGGPVPVPSAAVAAYDAKFNIPVAVVSSAETGASGPSYVNDFGSFAFDGQGYWYVLPVGRAVRLRAFNTGLEDVLDPLLYTDALLIENGTHYGNEDVGSWGEAPAMLQDGFTGAGVKVVSGTLTGAPIEPGTLVITDLSNNQTVKDDSEGSFAGVRVDTAGTNTIDYTTGAFTVTFVTAPQSSGTINAEYRQAPYNVGTSGIAIDLSNCAPSGNVRVAFSDQQDLGTPRSISTNTLISAALSTSADFIIHHQQTAYELSTTAGFITTAGITAPLALQHEVIHSLATTAAPTPFDVLSIRTGVLPFDPINGLTPGGRYFLATEFVPSDIHANNIVDPFDPGLTGPLSAYAYPFSQYLDGEPTSLYRSTVCDPEYADSWCYPIPALEVEQPAVAPGLTTTANAVIHRMNSPTNCAVDWGFTNDSFYFTHPNNLDFAAGVMETLIIPPAGGSPQLLTCDSVSGSWGAPYDVQHFQCLLGGSMTAQPGDFVISVNTTYLSPNLPPGWASEAITLTCGYHDIGGTQLMSINTGTGTVQGLAYQHNDADALALAPATCSSDIAGDLFVANSTDGTPRLFQVDKATGQVKKIIDTPDFITGLAFQTAGCRLFGILGGISSGSSVDLWEVNPATGALTDLGLIQDGSMNTYQFSDITIDQLGSRIIGAYKNAPDTILVSVPLGNCNGSGDTICEATVLSTVANTYHTGGGIAYVPLTGNVYLGIGDYDGSLNYADIILVNPSTGSVIQTINPVGGNDNSFKALERDPLTGNLWAIQKAYGGGL